MQEFDRAALVKSAEAKQRNGHYFWIAVAALPIIGIVAGFALGVMPTGGDSPMDFAEVEPGASVKGPAPETAPGLRKATERTESGYSARAEMEKYSMVVRTLTHCANSGPTEHYRKAIGTYRDANVEKTRILSPIAANEVVDYDLSAFENDIPTDPASIMVQGMTGQLAVTALQRANQFETMMADVESELTRRQEGFLGSSPSNADCTNFRNEVIMGKHNLSLPPSG